MDVTAWYLALRVYLLTRHFFVSMASFKWWNLVQIWNISYIQHSLHENIFKISTFYRDNKSRLVQNLENI